MKPHCSNQRNRALTLVEVLVVVFVLFILAAMFLPTNHNMSHDKALRISCINNLKEVGLAYRIWEDDHSGKYPMDVSATNGGTMELAATGNAVAVFQVISNELSTPKILYCPDDKEHIRGTNFGDDLTVKNVSYFVGVDAIEAQPQTLLSGDDNFAINGIVAKSGLAQLPMNANIAWTAGRHVPYKEHFWTPTNQRFFGNIGLADGSVQQLTISGLQQAIQQTGTPTNRLAIP